MRTKTSPIWKIRKNELVEIVKKSTTFTQILSEFKLNSKGGNTLTLRKRLNADDIDYSHIPCGRGASKGIARGGVKRKNLSDVMVRNSTYNRCHLKTRIIRDGIIEYKCSTCGFDPKKDLWDNEELILVLDHKNGVGNDHRKENLRFLCPNCNSQTNTFCGRNKRYYSGIE